MSKTSLQDEYNKEVRSCDIFVMLFFTKVGKYTLEEFETAHQHFQVHDRPLIFTYFKNAAINTGDLQTEDLLSLQQFRDQLKDLGHFPTEYDNTDKLLFHFSNQLEKLLKQGLI